LGGLPEPQDIPRNANYRNFNRTKPGVAFSARISSEFNLSFEGESLVFAPDWGSLPNPTLFDSAAVIYTFEIADYYQEPMLSLSWTSAPADPADLWVGAYNALTQRWVWANGSSEVHFSGAGADYIYSDGQAWIAVVLLGNSSSSLRELRFGPQLWQRYDVDSSADEVADGSSIALDPAGNPHIAYHNATQDQLCYASFDGSNWSSEVADPGPFVGSYPSLAFDSVGIPYIAYYDSSAGHPKLAFYSAGSWGISYIDESGPLGTGTDIAIDSTDTLHVAYLDMPNSRVRLATYTGGGWTYEDAGANPLNSRVSLIYDELDQPHLAYTAISGVRYASYDGGGWIDEAASGPDCSVDSDSALALDGSGVPRIVYYKILALEPGMATRTGPDAWSEHVFTTLGGAGAFSSLVFDNAGNPHVCFYGEGLDYRYYDGSVWHAIALDTESWTGHYISLAIGADDRLHISYRENSANDLKYLVSVP